MVSPSAPRFAAVLFDLDGTLVDSSEDLAAAVNHARAGLGLGPLSTERVRGHIGDGMPVLLARSLPDPALVPRAIELFRPYYAAHLLDRTRAYEGAEAALDALAAAGVPLGVVTNKPGAFTRQILERTGLARFFGAAVVGSDDGFGKKPERGPFDAALARLGGPPPERALMVGDGRNDVLGPRGIGMASCGVGWGIGDPAELRALRPDYWVERPGQLPGIVLGEAGPSGSAT
ncbi:MAG TPA: HAD-IA family hydrolase [Planctomycetota bacterium]|nr:HAD-IA family hydrolase [Planctomycetota bacterium]